MYLLSKEVLKKLERDYGDKGGVYKLHCLDKGKDGRFIPINRILGVDPEGVLYIGKANVFHNRIDELMKSVSSIEKRFLHPAGMRYFSNRRLQERFPSGRLCITVHPSNNPTDLEIHEMRNYFQKYGEVPPLNAQDMNDPKTRI